METSKASGTVVLRVGLALQCATAAVFAWRYPSPINSMLFLQWGVDEEVAFLIDRALVGLLGLLTLGVLVLARAPTFVATAFIFAAWAVAESLGHSDLAGRLSVFAQAVRFLAPLGLWLLLMRTVPSKLWGERLLRFAIALTFAVHGSEALMQHPVFLDLVLGAGRWFERVGGATLTEEGAGDILTVIGVVDLLLAGLVLVVRSRAIALWMAFWGLATAASRWVERGDDGVLVALLRSMNVATPLALFFIWSRRDD
ncbi:MAG: hypothetical protein WD226_06415 [Planctomycetota bacterium]